METYPQEIEVWYIIPAIRKSLADELINLGMKQKDVALKLNLTTAAISQYKKSKRGKNIAFPAIIKDKIKISAVALSNNANSDVIIQDLIKEIRKTCLCQLHKSFDDTVDCNCNLCKGEK